MRNSCKFNELVDKFLFEGKLVTGKSHVCGLINDTYIVDFEKEDGAIVKYVLQRINTDIFANPVQLMENIKSVTEHVAKKVRAEGGNPLRESLNLIPTIDGGTYYKTEDNEYWRAFIFIEGAKTYMMVQKPEDFYTCGKALGKFQEQLADFPADKLNETIPNFHNTWKRFEAFEKAVQEDKAGRVSSCKEDVDFILERKDETKVLVDLLEKGELPLRVTHNDTKYNNIMIDDITGEGICVIDLDTVMPGLSLYDFGDAIRSGATTAEEDEADLSKVNFDLNLYRQFTKGFLESAGASLTEKEIEYLPFSAKLITLELSMRFLMDHLNGDQYFKIARENHNLDRARNQLKLVKDMENNLEDMKAIVDEYCM